MLAPSMRINRAQTDARDIPADVAATAWQRLQAWRRGTMVGGRGSQWEVADDKN